MALVTTSANSECLPGRVCANVSLAGPTHSACADPHPSPLCCLCVVCCSPVALLSSDDQCISYDVIWELESFTPEVAPLPAPPASSGLSAGTIAGIVLGCIAFIALVALCIVVGRRWHAARQAGGAGGGSAGIRPTAERGASVDTSRRPLMSDYNSPLGQRGDRNSRSSIRSGRSGRSGANKSTAGAAGGAVQMSPTGGRAASTQSQPATVPVGGGGGRGGGAGAGAGAPPVVLKASAPPPSANAAIASAAAGAGSSASGTTTVRATTSSSATRAAAGPVLLNTADA